MTGRAMYIVSANTVVDVLMVATGVMGLTDATDAMA
jgi:hypothetical protein